MKQAYVAVLTATLFAFACSYPADHPKASEFLELFSAGSMSEAEIRERINIEEPNGQTPLYTALRQDPNGSELVSLLLSAGADPFQKQSSGGYPVRMLLRPSQRENFRISMCELPAARTHRFEGEKGNDLLKRRPNMIFETAVRGDAEHIDILAACGHDFNVRNLVNRTPLEEIASVNSETFGAMLDGGANPNLDQQTQEGICSRISRLASKSKQDDFYSVLPDGRGFCAAELDQNPGSTNY